MTDRRHFLIGAGALAACGWRGATPARAAADISALGDDIERIQKESGGRLGVAILDTALGKRLEFRAGDRFPMCSTFKLLAAAAVLKRTEEGKDRLDRVVKYAKADLVTYSPVTEKNVDRGVTLAALCEAAITLSDNTAGNLILAAIGGPLGFTTYARAIGDAFTRLDRTEPALNESMPGDPRDTTTPLAMLRNLDRLLLGDALSETSRAQLRGWMIATRTGDRRMRAGLPAAWEVGNKTGSGAHGSTNDIGIVWPPRRKPILFSVYLTETAAPPEEREARIAAIGLAVATALNG